MGGICIFRTYLQNRERPTDTESRLRLPKEKGGRDKLENGVDMYALLYII